jgi:2-methylisocitrate lyase-like PEP mutase family enzyme
MAPQQEAGARFRALHRAAGPLLLPNPCDAGTARLLELAGFEAIATSSAALAFSMGVGDGKVPRDETMRHVARIVSATRLPVSADLGNGFGRDPATVAQTIRLAASAGAVGGSIEDSTGNPDEPLYPLGLATERIQAAVEAARLLPFTFTLTARAESFLVGRNDPDDVLRRLDAYRDAGAHVLYAPGLPDEAALLDVIDVASGTPVNVLAGVGVGWDLTRLSELGVKRISLGSGLARTAFGAVNRAIAEFKRGRLGFLSDAAGLSEMASIFSNREALSEEERGLE